MSHQRTNPSDEDLLKKKRDNREFKQRSVSDAVHRADEQNSFGPDVEKEEQKTLAAHSAKIMSKRGAGTPAIVRRRRMNLDTTHNYVSLIRQANANYAAKQNRYNTGFRSA